MERNDKINELLGQIDEEVRKWNESEAVDERARLDESTKALVKEVNSHIMLREYSRILETDKPMVTAAKELTYLKKKVNDERVEDTSIVTRTVVDAEAKIDIAKLQKMSKDGIGEDRVWLNMAEKFNLLITMRHAADVGKPVAKELADTYYLRKKSQEIDMGKTPTSDTQCLKLLTSVIAAMIGTDYKKPTKNDVAYLIKVTASKNRKTALDIKCATHREFREDLLEICHKLIEDKEYTISSREFKEEK